MRTPEDEAFILMEKHKMSWEDVLGLSDEQRLRLLEQDEVEAGAEQDPEAVPEPEAEAEAEAEAETEEQPEDEYAGMQEDDVVGDSRRLRIVSVDSLDGALGGVVGEAWQGDDGELHGTGVVAVMLFESASGRRYREASLGFDLSPLTILYTRFARSPFLRAEFIEPIDGTS